MSSIKPFVVFPVASFHFSIVPWSKRTNQLVPYSVFSKTFLKKSRLIRAAIGAETFGEFLPIVSLNTFNRAWKSLNQMFKKYRRGIGTVLLKGLHKAPTGYSSIAVCSILIKPLSFSSIYKAYRRNKLHINLNTLTRVKHLLIGLGSVLWIGGLNGQKVFLTKEII